MKTKKILAIVLAFILLATALIVAAVANTKTTDVEITVDKTEISPGETATVSVKVTTNYPVATMSIPVFYDKTKVDVSEATATLTDYSVATVTTDSQSADSAKVYNNTSINSSEFGFVLVNYIGSAGQELADSINSVVLTFKITAKADFSGSVAIKIVENTVKTDENPSGMLYFGAPPSGRVIDEIPQNVENIDLSLANKKVSDAENPEENKNGWVQENGKWAYYENGVKVTNRWLKDSVGWCYVGADGYCVTNQWKADSKGWCYLDNNGRMVINNWVNDNGKWYFLDANGYMVSNCWKKDSNGWCYLGSSGAMLTNAWVQDSQGWCYVGADGYCVTNTWKKDSHGWCYLDSNGRMATNQWIKDSKGWCYVGADGYCVTNQWKADSKGWCYLDSNGRMMTNSWLQWNGNWYYLDENGYMVTGTKVINGKTYKFNSNGVWIG